MLPDLPLLALPKCLGPFRAGEVAAPIGSPNRRSRAVHCPRMPQMLQLRAWLVDSEPEIWRRLIVDPRFTLEQLHTVLQHAFGWTNSHLHQFHEQDGTRYAIPSPMDRDFDFVVNLGAGQPARNRPLPKVHDERKVLLATVFDRPKKRIAYEYDFGDSWMHAVELEKMVDPETIDFPFETFMVKGKGAFSGKPRAAMCIGGERNGPPEDCGGLGGYDRLLELKARPPHPTAKKDADARELLEWLGDWDPELVDLSEINQSLGRMRVKKAHAG